MGRAGSGRSCSNLSDKRRKNSFRVSRSLVNHTQECQRTDLNNDTRYSLTESRNLAFHRGVKAYIVSHLVHVILNKMFLNGNMFKHEIYLS